MKRLHNWQSRLSEYLTANALTRFEYGALDCGLFVAGAIEAMTGVDVAESLRGKYTNRREAFAAIRSISGIATMEAIAVHIAEQYGVKEVPVSSAQRGDAVVLKKGRASTLGIIAMHGTEVLMPYKDGILRVPIHLAKVSHAFHI
jgi:hypothetical protein